MKKFHSKCKFQREEIAKDLREEKRFESLNQDVIAMEARLITKRIWKFPQT